MAISLLCVVSVTTREWKYLYSKDYYAIMQNPYRKEQSQYHKIHAK